MARGRRWWLLEPGSINFPGAKDTTQVTLGLLVLLTGGSIIAASWLYLVFTFGLGLKSVAATVACILLSGRLLFAVVG